MFTHRSHIGYASATRRLPIGYKRLAASAREKAPETREKRSNPTVSAPEKRNMQSAVVTYTELSPAWKDGHVDGCAEGRLRGGAVRRRGG